MSDQLRISKILSDRQICSRREADEMIQNGWVEVEGRTAQIGEKADPDCQIRLSQQAKKWLNKKASVVLNKPVGFVSSQPEKGYRSAIELLTENNFYGNKAGKENKLRLKGLAPAGRLDIDSKGLMLYTQDGKLAKKIIHTNSSVSKEYIVKVDARVSAQQIEKLTFGLVIDGKKLKRAQIKKINDTLLNFTLWEGKKRQIRKMCQLVDLKVISLKRIRIGNIKLGELPEGQWRYLTEGEQAQLFEYE